MTRQFEGVDFDDAHSKAILRIDKRVYSKAAVLRACYWFSKDLQCQVEEEGDRLVVTATLRVSTPTLDQPRIKTIDHWLPDFFDTLLDSQLRVEIQTETAAVRELIIAKAFAESGVLEDPPPGTFADPVAAQGQKPNPLVRIANKPTE